MATPPGACIGADTVASYVARALGADESAAVEEHIDQCSACRELVSAVALLQSSSDEGSPALPSETGAGAGAGPGAGSVLPRGTRLGPYEIDRPLDAGGMGLVYVANDTRLRRQVALKGVREHRATQHGELLREATAMAKLAHPNVVHVFDVIDAHGQTFLAMELVVGSSVRKWLEAAPRSAKQIVDVFLQAGAGVAAAHAAGLVHRDIKPANMLVGDDGRVRITDFGIAGAPTGGDVEAMRGTPGFMAPEVVAGRPSDEKSDQFSFAVALRRALEARGPVPQRVARVLARAMVTDPAERYPTMRALLDALGRARRLPRALLAAQALTLLVVGGAAAFQLGRRRSEAELCGRPSPELVGLWDDATKARVHAAFEQTKLPYAADAVARLDAAVDAWTLRFAEVRRRSCEATWVERRQGPEALDAQVRCLASRAREARAAVQELSAADAAMVADAIAPSWQPSRLDLCLETRAAAGAPDTPATLAVREQLAKAHARAEAGRNHESLAAATEARAAAEATGDVALRAEALLRLGIAQTRTSNYAQASESLKQSLRLADSSADDAARAQASVAMMQNEFWQAHYEQVGFLGDLTVGATERAADESLTADVLLMVGASLTERGKPDEAKPLFERSLKLRLRLFGEHDRKVAAAYSALGNLLSMDGQLAEGLALHRRALETMRAAVGEAHPQFGRQYFNTAADRMANLEPAAALVELQNAARVLEAAHGPKHRDIAFALCELGTAQLAAGEHDAAIASLERGDAIWAEVSPKNVKRAVCIVSLSEAKRVPLERLEEAAALWPKAPAQFALARALTGRGPPPERALTLARAARQEWQASKLPRDKRELGRVEQWLAQHATPSR
ncbi:MAG: serine/threonine-protein kinase [Polyangiaceae bacterium]|nr:serine/threonine-protein kinase [Polyangiaceae bacterium]